MSTDPNLNQHIRTMISRLEEDVGAIEFDLGELHTERMNALAKVEAEFEPRKVKLLANLETLRMELETHRLARLQLDHLRLNTTGK